MRIDRQKFIALVRETAFGARMTRYQVNGVLAILDAWAALAPDAIASWIAYALATAKWETAHTMQPIAEFGKGRGRKYGVPVGPYRQVYYGRGFVQLTWLENYRKATEELRKRGFMRANEDLVREPSLAMRDDIAAAIMVLGMVEGWFTGHKLARHFNERVTEWEQARRIINGMDKAGQIARIARQFYEALLASRTSEIPIPAPVPAPPVAPPPVPTSSARPVLRIGAEGKDVETLQRLLNAQRIVLGVDGNFGRLTEAAVKRFQQSRMLVADGVVGPRTWTALETKAAA